MSIHPTAVVSDGAIIGDGVEIGPFAYVGPNVKIGNGCRLLAHSCVDGYTTIGERNIVHPFAALGGPAQDHGVEAGSVTYLKVGDDNVFREGFTAHTGTKPETCTVIGNHNLFMAQSHVAHNCQIGNNVIFVNSACAAGYVQVFDNAILSGLVAIHQFTRVGKLALISGCSAFSQDVPPFMMAEGRNGGVKMINLVGLKRGGFSAETIRVIKDLFKLYYHSGLAASNALKAVKEQLPRIPEVQEFIDFVESSKRGVVPPRSDVGHRA
jgi:UDP-N-acetylglucosamine acyltransferase